MPYVGSLETRRLEFGTGHHPFHCHCLSRDLVGKAHSFSVHSGCERRKALEDSKHYYTSASPKHTKTLQMISKTLFVILTIPPMACASTCIVESQAFM